MSHARQKGFANIRQGGQKMGTNQRDDTVMEAPNALLTLPGEGDLADEIVEAIRQRHGKVAIYVSLSDREPTLYLPHERRAIVGLPALYSTYQPVPSNGQSRR